MNTAESELPAFPLPPAAAPLRKRLHRHLFGMLMGGLVGAAVGAGVVHLLRGGLVSAAPPGLSPWLLALGAMLIAWLVLLVHEAGHLLAAKVSGLRPMSLMVGPLWLDLRGPGARVRFNRNLSTWGGLAMALPGAAGLSPRQLAATVAGGPGASLILAAVAAGAAAVLPPSGPQLVAQGLALMSGLIAMVTLLPWQAGGFASDGGQLLQLLRGDPQLQAKSLLSAVSALSLEGQRPRQWPAAWLATLEGMPLDGALRASALLVGALSADDQGDAAGAARRYRALALFLHDGGLQQLPELFRAAFMLPLVVYLAAQPGQLDVARAWLATTPATGLVDDYQRPWAQAAVAAFSGDREAALDSVKHTLAALEKRQDAGMAPLVRERLAAWGLAAES